MYIYIYISIYIERESARKVLIPPDDRLCVCASSAFSLFYKTGQKLRQRFARGLYRIASFGKDEQKERGRANNKESSKHRCTFPSV